MATHLRTEDAMTEPNPDAPTDDQKPQQQPAQAPAETDWKAEARKWEQRAKENSAQLNELKPKADQFAALEEASKSELQRIQEAHDAEKARADTSTNEALRMRVAMTNGLSADDLDLLGSGTEEELTARAQRIASLHAAATPPVVPPPAAPPAANTPLAPGASPTEPMNTDAAAVAARHARYFPAAYQQPGVQ